MSESVPPTSSEILYQNTSNQVAGNSELTFDTTYEGTRLDTANVLVSNRSILSGNVGIQTATPRGSLEVTGATILAAQGSELTGTHQFGLNGNYDSLSLVSPVGLGLNGTTSIFFGLNSLIYYPVARIVAVDNGNYSGSLAFQIGNGEQLYQQMRLTMDGVVTGNAAFLYKTIAIPTPGINIGLTFPSANETTSIIEVYVILQRTADTTFANMVKFTVFLGAQLYVTNITVQAIGSSTNIIPRNGVVVSGANVVVLFKDPDNEYTASINYMIYGPATTFLTKITYILNASLTFTVPGVPSGITGVPGDQSIFLNWNAPQNGGSPIIGYTILDQSGNSVNPSGSIDASGNFSSSLTSDAPGTLLITNATVLSTTSLNITGLVNGTAYAFRIKALNSVGYSGTNSITRTPATIPTAPLSVLATPENQSATVRWSPPSYNGGSAIISYTVIASPPSSSGLTFTTSGLSTIVTGLTNGTSYTFEVRATNSIGPSPNSSVSATIIPFTVPDPPTGVSATNVGSSITVTWTAPGNNQGRPITSYTIVSTTVSTGISTNTVFTGAIAVSSVNTTVMAGLTPGVSYTFTVFVSTSGGNSSESPPSNTAIIPGPPEAPTSVNAISGVASASVTWSAPISNGGSNITLYTITSTPGSFTATSATVTSTVVNGLTPGASYTFSVVATNVAGNSPPSLASPSLTIFTPPGPPTDLTAVAGTGTATLTWLSPSDTGNATISGYKIFNGANVYNPTTSTFDTDSPTLYSSLIPGITLTGLSNGTPYNLTIKTVNPAGVSTSASFPQFIPGLTPVSAPMILSTSEINRVDWLGIELLFYYPYNYGNKTITGPYIRIDMPADFLTNTIYHGRKIFTALINTAPALFIRFDINGNNIYSINTEWIVSGRFTAWALGPNATSLGVNTPANGIFPAIDQTSSNYGILVEVNEMGDVRKLLPGAT